MDQLIDNDRLDNINGDVTRALFGEFLGTVNRNFVLEFLNKQLRDLHIEIINGTIDD